MPTHPAVHFPHGKWLKRNCAVCEAELFHPSASDFPVCIRAGCRQVAIQKTLMPPIAFEQYFQCQARFLRESAKQVKDILARETALAQQIEEENRAFWKTKLSELSLYPPENYPLVPTPSCRRKIRNLPDKRRRHFRDRLNNVISEALAEHHRDRQSPSDVPIADARGTAVDAILAQSCAACAGGCCTSGGNHAYLNKNTLLRVIREHPNLRPRQILDYYLSRIHSKTYLDSCIFHTTTGCSLPVSLRSASCLDFFCAGLKDLISASEQHAQPVGAVILVRGKECWEPVNETNNQIEQAIVVAADENWDLSIAHR